MTAATDTATVPARLERDGTDLDAAVDGAILPRKRNGGRTCTAADRSDEGGGPGREEGLQTIPASAESKDIAVSW